MNKTIISEVYHAARACNFAQISDACAKSHQIKFPVVDLNGFTFHTSSRFNERRMSIGWLEGINRFGGETFDELASEKSTEIRFQQTLMRVAAMKVAHLAKVEFQKFAEVEKYGLAAIGAQLHEERK